MTVVQVPAGAVTVLLGSEPARRRLLAAMGDTTVPVPDERRRRLRRVVASPALPVVKRVVFLLTTADEAADDLALVLVDRATEGLGSQDRRFFLDHLRHLAARGAAVAVDDPDPVAALAVADHALRTDRGRLVLTQPDRWPMPDPSPR